MWGVIGGVYLVGRVVDGGGFVMIIIVDWVCGIVVVVVFFCFFFCSEIGDGFFVSEVFFVMGVVG